MLVRGTPAFQFPPIYYITLGPEQHYTGCDWHARVFSTTEPQQYISYDLHNSDKHIENHIRLKQIE